MNAQPPMTAATIISFCTDLEARSLAFYEALAARFPEQSQAFQRMAKDCQKSSTQVTRTYQETVTDALETGFSFASISLADYETDTELPAGADLPQAVGQALAMEETAIAFYQAVAESSESLLATIPRAFRRVAKTRRRRRDQLESM
jgi:rubrerythrin